MEPIHILPKSPPKMKRKSRKQPNPRKRVLKRSKLVFMCPRDCVCVHCKPSLLKIPGQCVAMVLDYMPKWSPNLTVFKYGTLLGDNLKTNDRDSYWWTGTVRPNSKVDQLQVGIFRKYTRGLQKRQTHPLVYAMLSGRLKKVPWTLYGDTWDEIPNSAREVTEQNKTRVLGFVFLQVERRQLRTHVFKLELQFDVDKEFPFQLIPVSWRFSVRPNWKFLCGRTVVGSQAPIEAPTMLFHPPHGSQRIVIGDGVQEFRQLKTSIMQDEMAWNSSVVNMQIGMQMGSWLPYESRIKGAYECKSRHLEQYYHVGIEASDYEDVPSFVDIIRDYGERCDVTIPLIEMLSTARGSDGKRLLVSRPFSLRNGLANTAVATEPLKEIYLRPLSPPDVFYI